MKLIKPSKVNGKINAPSSKSMMQRAVAASMLAGGQNKILNPSSCEDCLAALGIVRTLSMGVKDNTILDCNESGLSMRMFSAIAALYDKKICMTGRGSLLNRDVSMIENTLKTLGAECVTNHGKLPAYIKGPLYGGDIELDGSVTSQFLTGLLMVLPLCEDDSTIRIKNLKSKPYIDMTIALLKDFGIEIENRDYKEFYIKGQQEYKAVDYNVEGDWSGAAFMLVAGAIAGRVSVDNLSSKSLQADKAILDVLKMSGAVLKVKKNSVDVSQPEVLKAFEFDAGECPDLIPPLVTFAAFCKGTSLIKGTERLKFKESDRVNALLSEFKKIGVDIEHKNNSFIIKGVDKIEGGEVSSHNDHRIAMACAIAALNSKKGVKIVDNWECVNKSYPEFFDDLEKLI